MVESYVPRIDEHGAVMAVVELYCDVGLAVAAFERSRIIHAAIVITGLCLALLAIFGAALSADRQWARRRTAEHERAELEREYAESVLDRQARLAAEATTRRTLEMLSTLSHEARTPLKAIVGML